MKEKLEAFLCGNENWKKFIDTEPDGLKAVNMLNMNVTTFLQEGNHVYFDISIVYEHPIAGQKQTYESGIAILDANGNITEVRETLF